MKKMITLALALLLTATVAGCTPKDVCEEPTTNTEEITDAKPVIYLYPETRQQVSVKLELQGQLTCTYPAYRDGWTVTADPDGTLTDDNGQQYNYLYWEGITENRFDFSQGWCIKGEHTAAFLEYALEKLGLSRREANEFIVYWLPQMEQNPYTALAYLMLGDLASAKGEKDAARNWYEQCKAKCPTSALVTNKTVEMRLTLLDVDAPTQIAPAPAETDTKEQTNPFDSPFGDVPTVGDTTFNAGM